MRLISLIFVCWFATACSQIQERKGLKYVHRTLGETNDSTPVLILLHGYGSNEQDLLNLTQAFSTRFSVYSLRASTALDRGYAWFNFSRLSQTEINFDEEQLRKSREQVHDFIAALCKEDKACGKVFILGFSQGAMMALDFLTHYPESVDGVVALSGALLPTKETSIKNIRGESCFIGHGRADQIVNYDRSVKAVSELKQKGVAVVFRSYDSQHTILKEELADINSWFLGQ